MNEPKIRVRWTPRQKRDRVVNSIMESLKEGPKTFHELRAPLSHMGVSQQYMSHIIADLLLHDKKISQHVPLDEDYEELERVYECVNN